MKHTFRTYLITLALATLLLSACGGAPAAAPAEQAAVKVDASLIAYTGTIDSIEGDQWIVNGESLTIDPAIVHDGPFQVGDTVKVEGSVNTDGSFTVTRVEMPSTEDLTDLPQIGDSQTDGNTNDANTNDANSNDDNTNDDNGNDANSNDDNDNDDNSNDANSNDDDDDDDDGNSNSSNSNNSNDDDDDHDSSGDNSNDSSDDEDDDDHDDDDDDDNSNGS